MAAKRLRLEIVSGTTFTFDVEGVIEPRLEPEWKDAANPPQLERVRVVWTVTRARIVAVDADALWDAWAAFLARLQTRQPTAPPTSVRIVRDPGGANETVQTLGPATYQEFRWEGVTGEGTDDGSPAASWNVVAPVTLSFSAVLALADTDGIVGWRQVVRSTYDDAGLHNLEWETEVTTAEGTDARTKAETFAAIPFSSLGSGYSYLTNGPTGVDLETLDADENNARTPTRVRAVSRVALRGVDVGTTGPGTAPTTVAYAVTTERSAKGTSTIYEASAQGPNYLSWVLGRRPGGALAEDSVTDSRGDKRATGRWVRKTLDATAVQRTVRIQVRGGYPDFEFAPIAGGYAPVEFVGAVLAWEVTVAVEVEVSGGDGSRATLPFPGLLPDPLRLDYAASQEDAEPWISEQAKEESQATYKRTAQLVYRSATRPPSDLGAQLAAAQPVGSYYLG